MSMIDIFNEIESMRKKMDKMVEEFMRRPMIGMGVREPRAMFSEEGDSLKIKFELPGIRKENISIHLAEDSIELSAGMRKSREKSGKAYYSSSAESQSFQTYRSLPEKIKPETGKATYKDGVLEIIAKRLERTAKKKHKIKVS
jgi:HSP20 family protein